MAETQTRTSILGRHTNSGYSGRLDCAVTLGHTAHRKDTNLNKPEPAPQHNDSRPVWELVIEDMQKRDHIGREKYGTPLQAFNGRNPLIDAYQEALDLVVYLKQALIEQAYLDPGYTGKT